MIDDNEPKRKVDFGDEVNPQKKQKLLQIETFEYQTREGVNGKIIVWRKKSV